MDFLIDSFKQFNISLKELKCLLSLYKKNKLKEFRKNNSLFFSNLQKLHLPSINSTNSSFLKKVNKLFKRIMIKIGKKIKVFLVQLSQDPTFISLDTEFINNPSQTSYNNLTNYIKVMNDNFLKSLNLDNEFKITLSIMSDDRIPMYNDDGKRNTYENMIKGDIKFNSKDEYVAGIKSIATGEYEKYYPLQGIIISYKVGQTVIEKLEASPYGGIGVFALGASILFAVGGAKGSVTEAGLELTTSETALVGILTIVGIFLIIVGLFVLYKQGFFSQ
jgi:hypothetical protein